jgi:nucleoporin POM152
MFWLLKMRNKTLGRPPFQIMYNIAKDSEQGGTEITGQPTFNSIQPRTRFQLHTSTPGRMYYEVKQIGDTAYPLSKNKDTVIPRSHRLLFEQQISVRPSAHFRNRNRMAYCLYDALVPSLDTTSSDGFIVLEGTPPFTLLLSIKNLAASHVDIKTIQVPTNIWRLDLPSYTFTSIGPHLISIETVTDSSNCEQAALDPLLRSIWIDVAETAAIIPFERREDICVGELTQFQLEGIPPWTIRFCLFFPLPMSCSLIDL